ncbi:MAG: EAL domain-containing protein [Proteobacteria bacterium]|nr:EAL domain-containing protein [Pseudomonadota bacterium]
MSMSLIRQVGWLVMGTLLLAFVGAFGVSLGLARAYLHQQLDARNQDAAQTLALALGADATSSAALARELGALFTAGRYDSVRVLTADGRVLAERSEPPLADAAPAWFVDRLGLTPPVGVATVPGGGRVEVVSDVDEAHSDLWRGTLYALALLLLLAGVLGALAHMLVGRLRKPLDAVVGQALAITERRFVLVSEPRVPELRNVTRAMNAMVRQLQKLFNEQAQQVEMLRRLAHCDDTTGLSSRAHFMSRMKHWLGGEEGSASGGLVLLRLTDLDVLNQRLGRAGTDKLLQDVAGVLASAAERAGSHELGRLNGRDFAMVLPDAGSLREPAVDVTARLRNVLRQHDPHATAVVGAVRWWHDAPLSALLAAADQALARAEQRGPFSVELDDSGDAMALGEQGWAERLTQTLDAGRAQLVEFELVAQSRDVLHRECPLRLRLEADGPLVPAGQWLPMARRTQLMPRIDLLALQLALARIAEDGVARAINVSAISLQDKGFVPAVVALLAGAGAHAPGLWLEIAEDGALRQLDALRELVREVHAHGAHIGLEHAGERLNETQTLLAVGLDFIKLDASLTEGLAGDAARTQHVAGTVRMLRGIDLQVFAVGVVDPADAKALWACGVDGITGPVVARLQTQGQTA